MDLLGIDFSLDLGLDMAPWAVVLVLIAAVLGGVAQSTLGFGAAFAAVPALAVVAPELVPGAVLVSMLPISSLMVYRGRSAIDGRSLLRLTVGRLPGIAVGAWVVSVLPTRTLTVGIALLLLAAVGISALGFHVEVTPRRVVVAGFVSGLTGTAAALGGPPLALLYRKQAGETLRVTLAAVWTIGSLPALGSLAFAGEFTWEQFHAGTTMGVAALLGLVVGSVLLRYVADTALRALVLWWATLGAVLALGRATLG